MQENGDLEDGARVEALFSAMKTWPCFSEKGGGSTFNTRECVRSAACGGEHWWGGRVSGATLTMTNPATSG